MHRGDLTHVTRIDFVDWLKKRGGGDHPPPQMSVVDAHLPTSGELVVHDVADVKVTAVKKLPGGEFNTLAYSVRSGAGTHMVFVVWPQGYSAPGPNHLGWLPQLEFGELAGSTAPRAIEKGTVIAFPYKDIDGKTINLSFKKK